MTNTLRILFAVATMISVTGSFDAAFAKLKLPDAFKVHGISLTKKQQDGLQACYDWCGTHNNTDHSRKICSDNCEDYWSTHQG